MAIPQDKPNPTPAWATDLKAPAGVQAAAAVGASTRTATPPPEYGIALAIYVHKAVADAMNTFAETIRQMGQDVEPRTAAYNAAAAVAQDHERKAAKMGEGLR